MLIDWFTVAAQALNFVVLIWLMKRFLYKPILRAIDAREKKVAAELADADQKKAEARTERNELAHKNEELDRQRAELLKKATEEAEAERARLIGEARKAADALTVKRRDALEGEAKSLDQAVSTRVQREIFSIARKALADLASTGLEERMGEVFRRRLREMGGPAKSALAKALASAIEPAVMRSAFDLPARERAAIQNALNETFSAEVRVRFETAPELVSGVELATSGLKVGWSVAEYLRSLEESVGELLKDRGKAGAVAEPIPGPEPRREAAGPERPSP